MTKVKIVQIAIALSESESTEMYLDSKGRVWYLERIQLKDKDGGFINKFTYQWAQLKMPDEPVGREEQKQ